MTEVFVTLILFQDIFDENGLLIGKLRCQLFYEPIESSEIDSCENSQADQVANKNIRYFKLFLSFSQPNLSDFLSFEVFICFLYVLFQVPIVNTNNHPEVQTTNSSLRPLSFQADR